MLKLMGTKKLTLGTSAKTGIPRLLHQETPVFNTGKSRFTPGKSRDSPQLMSAYKVILLSQISSPYNLYQPYTLLFRERCSI